MRANKILIAILLLSYVFSFFFRFVDEFSSMSSEMNFVESLRIFSRVRKWNKFE